MLSSVSLPPCDQAETLPRCPAVTLSRSPTAAYIGGPLGRGRGRRAFGQRRRAFVQRPAGLWAEASGPSCRGQRAFVQRPAGLWAEAGGPLGRGRRAFVQRQAVLGLRPSVDFGQRPACIRADARGNILKLQSSVLYQTGVWEALCHNFFVSK